MNARAAATFGDNLRGEQTGFLAAPGHTKEDGAALEELKMGVMSGAGATVHYHCRMRGGEVGLFTATARTSQQEAIAPLLIPFRFLCDR